MTWPRVLIVHERKDLELQLVVQFAKNGQRIASRLELGPLCRSLFGFVNGMNKVGLSAIVRAMLLALGCSHQDTFALPTSSSFIIFLLDPAMKRPVRVRRQVNVGRQEWRRTTLFLSRLECFLGLRLVELFHGGHEECLDRGFVIQGLGRGRGHAGIGKAIRHLALKMNKEKEEMTTSCKEREKGR